MEGIETREQGLALVRGYDKIEKFVEEKGYSPFDREALKVIHTAYIACNKEKSCIWDKVKEEANKLMDTYPKRRSLDELFNFAIRILANKQKYRDRMTILYMNKVLPLL